MDIAQAVRPHLQLQNTIHWVKSIVIEQNAAGAAAGLARDLAVGHYKPINSPRFVNDCHEFIFHFTPLGTHAAGPDGDRRAVPGQVERDAVAVGRAATCGAGATPGSCPTRRSTAARRTGRTRPRSRCGCPSTACGCTARTRAAARARSVHRARQHGGGVRGARARFHRRRAGPGSTWTRRSRGRRMPSRGRAMD